MEKLSEAINRTKTTRGASSKSSKVITAKKSNLDAKCLKCGDAGYLHPLVGDKVDYTRTVLCPCQDTAQKQKLIEACGLPYGSGHMTFENFNVHKYLKEAYDVACQIAEGKGGIKWLTLLGEPNVGKTHLAVAICRRWLERREQAKYTYVPLFLDELRRGIELDGPESFEERFNYYCNVPLLVLDDLGVEKGTDWGRERLDTIIHYRGINGLYLIVTANLKMTDFPPRIASRLKREEFCRVVGIERE